jgi:hypothetical protein
MGNDGAAGVGPHGWIGIVGWLRIMAFSRTDTAGRSRGFSSGSGRSNTPDRVRDIGPTSEATTR